VSRKIHIAGLPVRVGAIAMQRCAWCGAVLSDCDYANTMSTSSDDPFTPFSAGHLVEVVFDGPNTVTTLLQHIDGSPMPAGFCGDDGPRLRKVTP
jgi:hypothetical protein